MPRIKINESEILALSGEGHILWPLYIEIRRYMDFETGISGLIRKFSEIGFIEALEVNAVQGRKIEKVSRTTLRNSLIRLEKIGLIRPMGNYVFKCLLADSDESVQKNTVQTQNRLSTQHSTEHGTNQYIHIPLKIKEKKDISNRTQDITQDITQTEVLTNTVLHPVPDTGIYISKKEKINKKEKSSEMKICAQRVIAHLDEVSGVNRRGENESYWHDVQFVQERLKGGATEQECINVIDLKSKDQWFVSEGYLCAATLFNKTKFAKYVREIYAKPKNNVTQGRDQSSSQGRYPKTATQRNSEYWDYLSSDFKSSEADDGNESGEIILNP